MNSYDRVYNLLLEYSDSGGKFDRKKSPLTPQQHDMGGKTSNKELRLGLEKMKPAIKGAKKAGQDIGYGREGDVKGTRAEKLATAYAKRLARGGKEASRKIVKAGKTKEKLKGWQGRVIGFNLEHPDYDPMIKGNKGEKIAARKHGKKAARRGTRTGFPRPGTKARVQKKYNKEAFAQADFGAKKPTESERVQRNRNRGRRRGADTSVRDQQKKGRRVIGAFGSGHFNENALMKLASGKGKVRKHREKIRREGGLGISNTANARELRRRVRTGEIGTGRPEKAVRDDANKQSMGRFK